MNAKDRYNGIIAMIEEYSQNPHMSADEIVQKIAMANGLSHRDCNAVMQYLTGDTLIRYIRERKLMAAYRVIIAGENSQSAIRAAVDVSGLGSQQSLSKKFSSRFGMPPGEAFKRKDASLLSAPLTWDVISCGNQRPLLDGSEVEQVAEKKKFGILQEQYAKAMEAAELEALYGLDPLFSDFAFSFSEKEGIPLKDAFRYADSLYEFIGDLKPEEDEENDGFVVEPADALKDWGEDEFIRFVFFCCSLTVTCAVWLHSMTGVSEEELMEQDPALIRAFVRTMDAGIAFPYFKRAYEYFWANADAAYDEEEFDQYIDYIGCGIHFEEAFSMVWPNFTDEELREELCAPRYEESEAYRVAEDFYIAFDKWAESETAYEETDLVKEYDPDNLEYEIEDREDRGTLDFDY